MNHVTSLAATLAGIVAGLTALGWLVTKAWRGLRSVGHLLDDLRGEPARPGVPARPGIMDRLAALEVTTAVTRAEVTHNGGGSLKDAVVRIERRVNEHVAMPHITPPTP